VLQGGKWVHERPYDVEVAEALDRAERRLTWMAARSSRGLDRGKSLVAVPGGAFPRHSEVSEHEYR
jgi:hypothetical protein